MNNNQTIYKRFKFESAHFLPNVPKDHKCHRLHGHSYEVIISVRGNIDEVQGWVTDYGDISKAVKLIINELDHQLLNDIEGLENPTAEKLCFYFWHRLEETLPNLYQIEIKETEKTGAILKKWKKQL